MVKSQVTLVFSLRNSCGIPCRSFAWVIILWYAFSFFYEIFRRQETLVPVFTLCLGGGKLLGALAFAAAERYKHDSIYANIDTLSTLQQPLLSSSPPIEQVNGDVESGQTVRRRKRSWIALVGIAAAYMWPQRLWLQVRAVICVILIIALRLLNLAVPIAYKRVIDEFSKITSSQKPPSAAPVPFASAFLPWVAVWLVLYFLQGGGGGGGAVGLIANLRS